MTAITHVTKADVSMAFPGVIFGRKSLRLPPKMTYDEWERLGTMLVDVSESSLFWLGTWAIYGEEHFGELYAQAISADSGYAVETVKVAQWVAERVPEERRHPGLSWAHHRAVAALEPEMQERFLHKAADENLTTRELYDHVKGRDPKAPADNLAEALRLLRQLKYELGTPVKWPSERKVKALLARVEL